MILKSDGTFARKTTILWITLIALSGSCTHKPLAGTYRAKIGDPRAGNSDKTDRRIVLRSDGTCSVTPPFLNYNNGNKPLFERCTYAIDHGRLCMPADCSSGGKQIDENTLDFGQIFVREEADSDSSAASRSKNTSAADNSSLLTTAAAQRAVDLALQIIKKKFGSLMTDNPKAMVQGVRDLPQQNIAIADIAFADTAATCSGFPVKYSWNAGTATFKHYTDGRWILTELDSGEIMCGGLHTFSIEAK